MKPKQLKRKIEKFVFQHELFLGDHPITPYELEQLTQSKNTAEILSLLTISSGDCLSCLKITPSQALSIPACDLVAPYARGIAFSKLAAVTYRLPTRQEWDEVASFLRQQTHNAEVLKETLINSFSDAVVQKNKIFYQSRVQLPSLAMLAQIMTFCQSGSQSPTTIQSF